MTDKIRRVAHFDDEKLERQFDEIIKHADDAAGEIEQVKSDINTDPLPEPEKPDASILQPTGFTAIPGFKRMTLSWFKNNLDEIYYYQLQFAISHVDSFEWQPWQTIVEPIHAHFYIHENLDFNYEYQYRVRAVTRDGRYSQWSRVAIGGQPAQISLSEEIIGNLDYDNLDPEMREGFDNIAVNIDEEDKGTISAFVQASNEISSSVAEMFSEDGGLLSTIQQTEDAINFRVVNIDNEGNIVDVHSQIRLGKVRDGKSYIYLEGDEITLNGETNIDGNLEVAGHSIVDGKIIGGEINIGSGSFTVNSQGRMEIGGTDPDFIVTKDGELTAKAGSFGGTLDAVTGDFADLISTGRIELKDNNNITRSGISGHPTSSWTGRIAIWAGDTYANRDTAPFRVTFGGGMYATEGEISGDFVVKGNINASHITAGTADFGAFSVTNFSADFIETGTLSADFLSAGTIDAYEINVVNLSASNIVTGTMKAGSIDASEAYVYNLSASEIETGILDAIEVKGVYGTFSDYLSAANNEIQLIQGNTGGVIQIRNDYNEIIAHLGNRREVAASEENDDTGVLVLAGEDGIGKSAVLVNSPSGCGFITLGNSEVTTEPLYASEGLNLRGGESDSGSEIVGRHHGDTDDLDISFRLDSGGLNNARLRLDHESLNNRATLATELGDKGSFVQADYGTFNEISADTKNFKIKHPEPGKEAYFLFHSAVESPNEGDNIYRYKIDISNKEHQLELPSYFQYLNKNVQVFISPSGHFGRAYGEINENTLSIYAEENGEYNILVIGTRQDEAAVNNWEGVEKHFNDSVEMVQAYAENEDRKQREKEREELKKKKEEYRKKHNKGEGKTWTSRNGSR